MRGNRAVKREIDMAILCTTPRAAGFEQIYRHGWLLYYLRRAPGFPSRSHMAWKPFLVLVALALSTGCDRGAEGGVKATVGSHRNPTAGGAAKATQGPASLAVSPDSVDLCKSGSLPSGVLTWRSGGAGNVRLTVSDPKSRVEKSFGRGRATGQKQTGPWLKPGLVFRLRDASSNAELAAATIKAIPCH
jgi:hypothetical protein